MIEVPADFVFEETATLTSLEEGMRAVESNVKFATAILAASLGRIKREALYKDIAPNFKNYVQRQRTTLSYQNAIHLAAIGEKFWEYRTELKENEISLSSVMTKIRLLEKSVTETDPMIWK
jgi:hypothetical protein